MLVVVLSYEEINPPRVFSFHVGGQDGLSKLRASFLKQLDDKTMSVSRVSADGHELRAVVNQLTGLPLAPKKPVQEWTGDLASFVFLNIDLDDLTGVYSEVGKSVGGAEVTQ